MYLKSFNIQQCGASRRLDRLFMKNNDKIEIEFFFYVYLKKL